MVGVVRSARQEEAHGIIPSVTGRPSDSACEIRDVPCQRNIAQPASSTSGPASPEFEESRHFLHWQTLGIHDPAARTISCEYVSCVKHMAKNQSSMSLAYKVGNCGPRIVFLLHKITNLARDGMPTVPSQRSPMNRPGRNNFRGPNEQTCHAASTRHKGQDVCGCYKARPSLTAATLVGEIEAR